MKYISQLYLLLMVFTFSFCSTIDTAVEEDSLIEPLIAPLDSISYYIDGVHYSNIHINGYNYSMNSNIYRREDPDYFHLDSVSIASERHWISAIRNEFGIKEKFHRNSELVRTNTTSFFYINNPLHLFRKPKYDFILDYYRHHDENGVKITHSSMEGGVYKQFNSYDSGLKYFPATLPEDSHANSYCEVIGITTFSRYSIVEFEFEVTLFPEYNNEPDYPNETLRLENGYVRLIVPKKSS